MKMNMRELICIDKENVKKKIESSMIEQSNRIEDFINNGSNCIFKSAIAMDVEVGGINPIYAGRILIS